MTTAENQSKTFRLWQKNLKDNFQNAKKEHSFFKPSEKTIASFGIFIKQIEQVVLSIIEDNFRSDPDTVPESLASNVLLTKLAATIISAHVCVGTSPE